LNRNRVAAALLGVIAIAALTAVAANNLIKRSDAGFRIRPPPAWTPSRPDSEAAVQKAFHLDAPRERANIDAGVADAARKFAIQLVTPDLKVPESAEFPEDAIRFERLILLNQTTAGRIEHWLVDGAVDSRNDFGIRVRSHWRMLLARADDGFFPVMAQLGDFEI
jgi:hypothetical protein